MPAFVKSLSLFSIYLLLLLSVLSTGCSDYFKAEMKALSQNQSSQENNQKEDGASDNDESAPADDINLPEEEVSVPPKNCPLETKPVDQSQCNLPPKTASNSNSNFKTFEKIWWRLKNQYAYFKERKMDWNCEYDDAVKTMGFNPSSSALKNTLKMMLANLQDGHVSLDGDGFVDYGNANPYRHKKSIQQLYLANGGECPNNSLCVGTLTKKPEMGYIRLDLMEGRVSPQSIRSALLQIENVKGLIVDLRFNDGGYDSTALSLMGHFTQNQILSHYKEDKEASGFENKRKINVQPSSPYFDIPIYVLSSPVTASAAEIGVMAANSLANQANSKVTTIGGRSEGITSDIISFREGGFEVDFSGERYSSPEPYCEIYEKVGVSVKHDSGYANLDQDLKVRLSEFDKYLNEGLANNKDPDIEKALLLFSQIK